MCEIFIWVWLAVMLVVLPILLIIAISTVGPLPSGLPTIPIEQDEPPRLKTRQCETIRYKKRGAKYKKVRSANKYKNR